jgi:hypothetical protein
VADYCDLTNRIRATSESLGSWDGVEAVQRRLLRLKYLA